MLGGGRPGSSACPSAGQSTHGEHLPSDLPCFPIPCSCSHRGQSLCEKEAQTRFWRADLDGTHMDRKSRGFGVRYPRAFLGLIRRDKDGKGLLLQNSRASLPCAPGVGLPNCPRGVARSRECGREWQPSVHRALNPGTDIRRPGCRSYLVYKWYS